MASIHRARKKASARRANRHFDQPWYSNARKRAINHQGSVCHYCKTQIPRMEDVTVDHVVPESKGGTHEQWNLVVSCDACNQEKADNDPTCSCDFCVRAVERHKPFWERA